MAIDKNCIPKNRYNRYTYLPKEDNFTFLYISKKNMDTHEISEHVFL